MNPEQIKDEIRKLNWIDKIGIYRWINQEVAGDRGIGTDRSRQIRQDMERIAGFPVQEGVSLSAESKNSSNNVAQLPLPKKSGSDFVGKNDPDWRTT